MTAALTGGTMMAGGCDCGGVGGATEVSVTLLLASPGAVAVTVTVPGVKVLRRAIFCNPPSKFSSGSPGEWKNA